MHRPPYHCRSAAVRCHRPAVRCRSNPASALQAAPKQYVDSQVACALPLAGGTLTGALTLAGDPTTALQAATKRYVDSAGGAATGVINVRSAPYNAQLNGVTDDTAAFKAAYQAAAPGSAIYVPNGVTVLQTPSNWGIPADQAGEVDRRRYITAGRHAAVECNSRRRQSGQAITCRDSSSATAASASRSRRTVRSQPISRFPIRPTSSITPAGQPAAR